MAEFAKRGFGVFSTIYEHNADFTIEQNGLFKTV